MFLNEILTFFLLCSPIWYYFYPFFFLQKHILKCAQEICAQEIAKRILTRNSHNFTQINDSISFSLNNEMPGSICLISEHFFFFCVSEHQVSPISSFYEEMKVISKWPCVPYLILYLIFVSSYNLQWQTRFYFCKWFKSSTCIFTLLLGFLYISAELSE